MLKYLRFKGSTLYPAVLLVGIFEVTLELRNKGCETQELSLIDGSKGKALRISCQAEKKPLMQIRFTFLMGLNFRSPKSRILCLPGHTGGRLSS